MTIFLGLSLSTSPPPLHSFLLLFLLVLEVWERGREKWNENWIKNERGGEEKSKGMIVGSIAIKDCGQSQGQIGNGKYGVG